MKEFFGDQKPNKPVYFGFDAEARKKSGGPYEMKLIESEQSVVEPAQPRIFVNTIRDGVMYDPWGKRIRALYR